VGESGSGKSTLGRVLLRLTEADSGSITWHSSDGSTTDLRALASDALRRFRPQMQAVFQDPFHSLNPSRPAWQIVGEGLFAARTATAAEIREKALLGLRSVGLDSTHLDRLPHEFSGGQRQRIAIARALILEPQLLVCDEVTSALDTRTQAQVIELLRTLQQRSGLTILFISHDLPAVASISHQVAVLRDGRVVEQGAPERLFSQPTHPYTRALLAALPHPDPRHRTFRPVSKAG